MKPGVDKMVHDAVQAILNIAEARLRNPADCSPNVTHGLGEIGKAGDEGAAKRLMPVRARLATAVRDAQMALNAAIVAEAP